MNGGVLGGRDKVLRIVSPCLAYTICTSAKLNVSRWYLETLPFSLPDLFLFGNIQHLDRLLLKDKKTSNKDPVLPTKGNIPPF